MGVIDKLKGLFSKEKSLTLFEERLDKAFSKVHSDVQSLNMSVKNLHIGHQLTKQDVQNITAWLGYLKSDAEKAEKNFEKISSWLMYLHESSQKNKKSIEKLEFEVENLKQRALQHVATGVGTQYSEEITSKAQKSTKGVATGVANVGNVANINEIEISTPKDLPNPLKLLLNFLISTGEPMSYQQIAEKMGKSKITVRVNMSWLKKRGLVEEYSTPNGTKLFSASNRERVKKLYNVQVL